MVTEYRSIPQVDLEKVYQARTTQWVVQMVLINMMEFVAESSRGLVMPTMYLYCVSLGGDLIDMGLLTSIFSAGRLLSSICFGWLCDRYSFRAVYIASSIIGLIGNLLYVISDPSTTGSMFLLVSSRFIIGFGAGNRSVCRADVAKLTRVDQRLRYMTILCTVVFFGYALTPGLGALIVGFDWNIMGLHIHALNMPGAALVILNAFMLLGVCVGYNDNIGVDDGPSGTSETLLRTHCVEAPQFHLPSKLVHWGVGVFMVLNIIGRGILSVFETINVPLYLDVTGFSNATAVESAASFQFNMGLLGLLSYLAIEVFRHSITDTAWLLIGLSALVVGNGALLVLWPLTFTEFAVGIFFIWSIGSPLITAVSVAAFSKILGSRQQGTWMGILGSTASVSRIVLPLLPALFSTFIPMFIINVVMCIVGIGLLVWYDKVVTKAKSQWSNQFNILPGQASPY